jgi:hypothetical protein
VILLPSVTSHYQYQPLQIVCAGYELEVTPRVSLKRRQRTVVLNVECL